MGDDNNGNENLEDKVEELAVANKLKERFGAKIETEGLERADGRIPAAIDKGLGQHIGVISTILQPTKDDEDYRSALVLAYWGEPNEDLKACNAINEARRFGLDFTPIVDRLNARRAWKSGWLIGIALRALTHTEFSFNRDGKGGGGGSRWPWKRGGGDKSPVST